MPSLRSILLLGERERKKWERKRSKRERSEREREAGRQGEREALL